METKKLVKAIWARCKPCLFVALFTLIVLYVLNLLKLGKYLPKLKGAPTNIKEFTKDINNCFAVFKTESLEDVVKTLGGKEPILDIYDDVRFIASKRESGKIDVVIRGSNNIENWADNFDTSMRYREGFGESHYAYSYIAEGIAKVLINKYGNGNSYRITGGSLGGALAVLVGAYLTKEFNDVYVVTVGSPKCTKENFKFPVVHIRHECDPVPYLPLWTPFSKYDHDGLTYVIRKNGLVERYSGSRADYACSLLSLRESLDPSVHTKYREFL